MTHVMKTHQTWMQRASSGAQPNDAQKAQPKERNGTRAPRGEMGPNQKQKKKKRSFFFSQPEVSDKKKNGNQMGLFLQKRFLKLRGFVLACNNGSPVQFLRGGDSFPSFRGRVSSVLFRFRVGVVSHTTCVMCAYMCVCHHRFTAHHHHVGRYLGAPNKLLYCTSSMT